MILKAYAKVNLILNVLGKRADGYHEIESIMQADENLYDIVEIVKGSSAGNSFPFGETDLAKRALDLLKEEYDLSSDYSVKIEKHIPSAAGLGGGSSDAAAVVFAVCKMEGIDLDDVKSKPYVLSGKLGADVPFALAAQNGYMACIARGIGDILTPISPLDIEFCYSFSDFKIENKTKRVYEEFDKEENHERFDTEAFLLEDDVDKKISLMGNMLQGSLENITGIKRNEILCGAGPTYFTVRRKK